MISQSQLQFLRQAHSPQVHGGGTGTAGLTVTYIERTNPASVYLRMPCWAISDGAGYITATALPEILHQLIYIEAKGGPGTVRELITGVPKIIGEEPPATPEAMPTLEDLLG